MERLLHIKYNFYYNPSAVQVLIGITTPSREVVAAVPPVFVVIALCAANWGGDKVISSSTDQSDKEIL